MQDFAINFLLISLLIGVISYVICMFLPKKYLTSNLSSFLFGGNSSVESALSIVGTIFSGSILFTGMIVFYKMYGLYLMPIFAGGAIIGFIFLIRATQKTRLWTQNKSNHPNEKIYLDRLSKIISSTGNVKLYFAIVLLYLISSFVTELAVFKAALSTFEDAPFLNNFSALFLIIMISSYVYLSGFKGVLVTDFLQFTLIVLSFIGLFYILLCVNEFQEIKLELTPMKIITNENRILMGVATFLVSVSFLSSIPEIFVRITTLNKKRNAKKTAIWACVGVCILLTLPMAILMINEGAPLGSIQLTEVFKIWKVIINDENNVIFAWLIMTIIVAAIFTTLDTYLITCEQMVFLAASMTRKNISFLRNNFRYFSLIFLLISVLMANHLSQLVKMIIGAMSISFPIMLFFMIHVFPKFKIEKVSSFVYLIPLIFVSIVAIYVSQQIQENKPSYYFIPITTGASQVIVATIYLISRKQAKGT